MQQPEAGGNTPMQPRTGRFGNALTGRERASIGGMAAVVLLLHAVGWGVLLAVVAAENLPAGSSGVFGVGLGVAAYTLGLRHAFDADHIAAIDNTTRKLAGDGHSRGGQPGSPQPGNRHRPMTVGFWFSLGHSSIVFGLCALLAAGIRSMSDQGGVVSGETEAGLQIFGTAVSGVFLYLIGVLNLVILLEVLRSARRLRSSQDNGAGLENQPAAGGLMTRLFGRLTGLITKPWQMYGVGLLFGLGFDTATEVSLLILAAGAAASALPWYAILTLPVLFAAGMSLLDSLDGCFMTFAYRWALSRPVRRIYYNVVVTGLSVAVALGVGSVQLISLLVDSAGIRSGPLAVIGGLDLAAVGYTTVALFIFTWLLALGVWRFGHIEERWSMPVPEGGPE
ncbi:HoxN/HupN/NixA family nickel/cobalt transporter [Pseudarthrobacter sp. SSS035]|uniref:HoxN/HupN/NixA family nickel/cobalt transporter n=1 Tax=Pseudarthrobacter sp. SSS035 TaxID=2931399 RepID=UPI00200CB993|nr:HoxN/HupN/NixA family nickel/cobalt transporter [Pseudarthrobacter sp. SSS035]